MGVHPLASSKELQLNPFADDHPKGYGLLLNATGTSIITRILKHLHKGQAFGCIPSTASTTERCGGVNFPQGRISR